MSKKMMWRVKPKGCGLKCVDGRRITYRQGVKMLLSLAETLNENGIALLKLGQSSEASKLFANAEKARPKYANARRKRRKANKANSSHEQANSLIRQWMQILSVLKGGNVEKGN